MIVIPKNIIVESKYTSGGKYFVQSTSKPYSGFYFTINERAYTGKKPTNSSQLLIEGSSLLLKTAIAFGVTKLTSVIFQPKDHINTTDKVPRYFAKRLNTTPILILEIDKKAYDDVINYQLNYQLLHLDWNILGDNINEIEKADLTFVGIKQYLLG